MKEWIIANTDVTEEEYDSLINPDVVTIEGISKEKNKEPNKIFDHPMLAIDLFTLQKPTLKRKIKYRVIRTKTAYVHKKIKFMILADLLKAMQAKLYTIERKGKCFTLSREILITYTDTNILTAMCIDPYYKEPTPFLHCIILSIDPNGREMILDPTFNIAIDKETYFNLLKANVITNISRETFVEDSKTIYDAGIENNVSMSEYLCFHDKIITTAKNRIKAKKKES